MTTLTTVGYGDISPQEDSEMLFAALSMIIGGAFYGYIIANLASMMQGLDANARVFHERMDAIVSYMRHRNFPKGLFRRINRYYTHYYECKTALDETHILNGLSNSLQQEVARFLSHDIFCKSYLLKSFRDSQLMTLLGSFSPIQAAIDDVVFQVGDPGMEMFFITQGNVFAFDNDGNRLIDYKPGSVFGEFACLGLIGGRIFNTQCLDLCEMCSITRNDLEEASYAYPTQMNTVESHARKALSNITRKLDLENVTGTLKMLAKRRDLVLSDSWTGRVASIEDGEFADDEDETLLTPFHEEKEGTMRPKWLIRDNDNEEQQKMGDEEKAEKDDEDVKSNDILKTSSTPKYTSRVDADALAEELHTIQNIFHKSVNSLRNSVESNRSTLQRVESMLMKSLQDSSTNIASVVATGGRRGSSIGMRGLPRRQSIASISRRSSMSPVPHTNPFVDFVQKNQLSKRRSVGSLFDARLAEKQKKRSNRRRLSNRPTKEYKKSTDGDSSSHSTATVKKVMVSDQSLFM